MAIELQFADTFSEWRDKINALVQEFNQNIIDQGDAGAFGYVADETTGLTVKIKGGKVRDSSVVDTLTEETFTLPANETVVVAIYKEKDVPAELQVHTIADLPQEHMIPVALFETDATSVLGYEDLRTPFNTGAGGAGGSADTVDTGVLTFNQSITENVTIPVGKHGLSINPVVEDGITVTVEAGSEWVVL